MKYKSKKGTTIDIPDGLTTKQIASIKADADAGYGTRAQKTANDLGRQVVSNRPTQISKTTSAPAATSGGLTPRQQARLNFLLKHRPNDPQVKKLQAIQAGAVTNDQTGEDSTADGGDANNTGAANNTGSTVVNDRVPINVPADFDVNRYLTENPDVATNLKARIAAGAQESLPELAWDHYDKNGRVEGRAGWYNDPQRKGADASGYQPGPERHPAYDDTPLKDPGGSISDGTVNPDTGTIDPVKASDDISKSETSDVNTNFQLEHPQLITDQNGNSREITRHADGTVTIKDTAGGTSQTFKDLATAAAQSFNGAADRTRAEDATYNTLTKYYDRDMQREQDAAKQELAERGIPYDPVAEQDPNSKNLYGRTVGGINEKYRGLKDTASQQAVISGNQVYATDSAARDSFLNTVMGGATTFGGNWGTYTNDVVQNEADNDKEILSMSAQQYATLHGMTLQEAQSKRDDATKRAMIASQEKMNDQDNATSTENNIRSNAPSPPKPPKPAAAGAGFDI